MVIVNENQKSKFLSEVSSYLDGLDPSSFRYVSFKVNVEVVDGFRFYKKFSWKKSF